MAIDEHPRGTPANGAWRIDLATRVFRHVPTFVAARLTTFALAASGVKIGKASIFWAMPTLVGPGDICSRLTVGTFCGFNVGCYFELADRITIRDHVAVGHDVMFLTRSYAAGDPEQRGRPTGSAPIEIGEGAWLGSRCVILPGVTIGAGSVIGASVVVSRDVPPNMMVTGGRNISLAKWR